MAARRILSRAEVERLAERFEPILRSAFLEAISDIRNHAEIARIAEALERGDIEAALRAVHLDPAVFRGLERGVADAFVAGGSAAADAFPNVLGRDGLRVVVRFDVRNPRAEAWLSTHSSEMVTNIVEDQRNAIRAALTDGLARGANPRSTALDVIGRYSSVTRKREGGIVGLTSAQERYVANARRELMSGDVAQLRNYLTRARRDARFDSHVLKAIRGGQPIDQVTVSRMTSRYSDSLLELRGETIARTETMASLNHARKEAVQQAIDSGAVRQDQVTKVWRAAMDERTRYTHREMNGQTVRIDGKFLSPSGAVLDYPGDPAAPIEETANCRCTYETRVDFLADIER